MDPAQALADLTEVSSQIEVAVLARSDRSVVASTLSDEARSGEIAGDSARLFEGAVDAANGRGELTQLWTSTREGCVFVVRDERHLVAAVTGPEPTVGLVLHDLKTCLRLLAEEDVAKPKAKAKRRSRATKTEAADA